MSTVTLVLLLGGAVFLGSVVQGTVGYGLSVVSVPIVALLDPTLVPGCMLMLALVLPCLTVSKERAHVKAGPLAYAVAGRLLATPLGVLLVATLSPQRLGALVGVLVLGAVVVSLLRLTPALTRPNIFVAGALSGVMGTAVGIGGPPLAILYQHASGPVIRASLGSFFVLGSALSLLGLGLAGELTWRQAGYFVTALPFLVAGFLLAQRLRGRVDAALLRPLVLMLATVAACAVMVRGFLVP